MNEFHLQRSAKMEIGRLRNRSEFIALRKGNRNHAASFLLQSMKRKPHDNAPARVGYTLTKKIGNAVVRNRIKRRLREVADTVLSNENFNGFDYVLIGKRNALHENFQNLICQLETSAKKPARGNSRNRYKFNLKTNTEPAA